MAEKLELDADPRDREIRLLSLQVHDAHEVIKALLEHKKLGHAKLNAVEGVTCRDCGAFGEVRHQTNCPISRAWLWQRVGGFL